MDGVFLFAIFLASNKRQECHKTCALHCLCKLALMLCADTGAFPRDHACMRRKELFDDLGVLVVDKLDVIC